MAYAFLPMEEERSLGMRGWRCSHFVVGLLDVWHVRGFFFLVLYCPKHLILAKAKQGIAKFHHDRFCSGIFWSIPWLKVMQHQIDRACIEDLRDWALDNELWLPNWWTLWCQSLCFIWLSSISCCNRSTYEDRLLPVGRSLQMCALLMSINASCGKSCLSFHL